MFTGRLRPVKLPGNGYPQCRLYAWKSNPAFEAEAQPTVTSEDGSRTLRTRQHGNKTLPMPPLMDPLAIAGKQRHKQTKGRASKNDGSLSDFQKKLRLNPYAHALATEIRQDRLTQARIPSHFLIPFAPKISPSDQQSKPTLVPVLRTRAQGKTYAFATREAMDTFKGKKGKWQMMLNEHVRMRAANALGKRLEQLTVKDFDFVEDVGEKVLEELRENVVQRLEGCRKRGMLVQLGDEGNEHRDDLACLLTSGTTEVMVNVFVHNIDLLLSPEQKEFFREKSSRLGLLRHKQTMGTLLALEKLNNYVRRIEQDRPA